MEEAEQENRDQRKRADQPQHMDDPVDLRARVGGPLFGEEAHERIAEYGDQKPAQAPVRIGAREVERVVEQRDADGRVAPDEKRAARVALEALAGVADHAADELQAFGGIEAFFFHDACGLRG